MSGGGIEFGEEEMSLGVVVVVNNEMWEREMICDEVLI